jgi:hypothetical protein
MALDDAGGLGDLRMRGYGGAPLRNTRPIDPRMAKLGMTGIAGYYLYAMAVKMLI